MYGDIIMIEAQHVNQQSKPFNEAVRLARTGRKKQARQHFQKLVESQPDHQTAWLWLSVLAPTRAEAEHALAQARQIDPARPSLRRAERWVAHHFTTQPIRRYQHINMGAFGVVAVLVLGCIGLLLWGLNHELNAVAQARQEAKAQTAAYEAQLAAYREDFNTAWQHRNWTRVIAVLRAFQQVEPDAMDFTAQLAHAHLQQGMKLRHTGHVERAMPFFEHTITLEGDAVRAETELDLAGYYLEAVSLYEAGHWAEAIQRLEQIQKQDRYYANIKDMLYSAHYNHGLALTAAQDWVKARAAFEAALALRPAMTAPRLELARVEYAMAPENPPSIEIRSPGAQTKLIVVGIAEQRMHVYERNKQIFEFVVSTGEPGSATVPGEFEILNKIEVAYASTWNLDMPYWMGIYWAGPLQNGIHALPIVRHTGYKLWDGYLGQRVSYGCVILGDDDAATLYEWADVGTKVIIVPSLVGWEYAPSLLDDDEAE